MTEQELLRDYVRTRAPAAFTELAQRNVDLVYAAARRQLRDAHLAEDVTQAVFVLLARKAGAVRGPLAGWLLKATYFCCRDAQRIADRRAYHERQAMKMRPAVEAGTSAEEPAWEAYAPLLDAALLGLRARDRDAITLRYLKGLSLREVGTIQGIGEEAARKRVDRAMTRLRAAMAAKANVPNVAALTAAIALSPAHAAPAGLAHSIAATAGAAAKGGLAGAIANAGAKWMAWAKMKLLAGITTAAAAAVIGTAGAATVYMHRRGAPPGVPISAAVPAPVPPAVPTNPDQDESQVPGAMQIARWDVILTQTGADAVGKVLHPIETKSVVYTASTVNGVALRRAVRQAIADDEVARVSTDMQIGDGWNDEKSLLLAGELWFDYTAENPSERIMITGGSNQRNDTFDRIDANHLHVKLDHTDINASINELTDQWRWAKAGSAKAIVYEGTLPAGDAVAFVGKYVAQSGTPYYHLVVWETFKAQPQQMALMALQRDAGWWCENGPSRLRLWADAARVWAAQAPTHLTVTRAFEKTLEDGEVVSVEALCRPSRWPCCWWDAEGNPSPGPNGLISFKGDPPEGLWALVSVSSKGPEITNPSDPHNASSGNFEQFECQQIDDSTGTMEAGIAVGAWKQITTLEMDKSQSVNDVEYRISRPNQFSAQAFLIHFLRVGVLDNDDMLVPTAADGRTAYTPEEPTILFVQNVETARKEMRKETQPNYTGLPLADVRTWRVMQRKRQWVTFTGIATSPKITPPTAVTNDAANLAERAQEERERKEAAEAFAAQRKAWAAIPPDRTTVPGALRALVDATRAGDEAAVRKMFVATKPAAQRCLDAAAHYFVAEEQAHQALVNALGRDVSNDELEALSPGRGHLLTDVEPELFTGEWKSTAANRRQMDDYCLDKGADGDYRLNLDILAEWASPLERLTGMIGEEEHLRDVLRTKGGLTLPELKTILEPRPATTTQK